MKLEASLNFEGIEPTDYLTHQPDTTAELNINRSYDDLLDVSTTYLGADPCSNDRCILCTAFLPYYPLTVTLTVNC